MKIVLFLILLFTTKAFCNEAILEVAGGSVSPLYNSNTNVSLDSEVVVITLNASSYTVNAKFYFSNEGATEILAVGFPKYAYGYYNMNGFRGVEFFNYFETFVNDIPVEFQEMMSDIKSSRLENQFRLGPGFIIEELVDAKLIEDNNWLSETKWMVKNVIFKMFQPLITEINYEAPYADYGFYKGAEYLYGTGKTWKGNIKNARFIINFSEHAWPSISLDHRRFIREEYQLYRLNEYSIELLVKDFEPYENAVLSFTVSDERFPWDWQYEFYSKNLVSDDQLKLLNLKQLRIFRNSFYARHGRSFKSDDLRTFFKEEAQFKINETYHDSLLNEVELENVKKIYDYEQKLKNTSASNSER